jgi:hypothetical protein
MGFVLQIILRANESQALGVPSWRNRPAFLNRRGIRTANYTTNVAVGAKSVLLWVCEPERGGQSLAQSASTRK